MGKLKRNHRIRLNTDDRQHRGGKKPWRGFWQNKDFLSRLKGPSRKLKEDLSLTLKGRRRAPQVALGGGKAAAIIQQADPSEKKRGGAREGSVHEVAWNQVKKTTRERRGLNARNRQGGTGPPLTQGGNKKNCLRPSILEPYVKIPGRTDEKQGVITKVPRKEGRRKRSTHKRGSTQGKGRVRKRKERKKK